MSEEKEIIINGVNVSECKHLYIPQETKICQCLICETGEFVQCKRESNCYFKQLKRLQQENEDLKTYIQKMDKPEIKTIDGEIALKNIELQQENKKIKKQYNCYACGNCRGKEDYINLEKHHKEVRKQFDKLVKRNNTLSLRIEELEKENEKLKEKIHFKNLYKLSGKCFFDEARQCNYFDDFVKARQALEEIRNEANRLLYEENPIYGYNDSNYFEILAKYVLAKTEEVLNDRD